MPLSPTGGPGRRGFSRPLRPGGQLLTQQHRRGVRSQSKESTPPKDLDLVTKRLLSARLLKINDLRNSLAELQQRTDELQRENRVLRQVDLRSESPLGVIHKETVSRITLFLISRSFKYVKRKPCSATTTLKVRFPSYCRVTTMRLMFCVNGSGAPKSGSGLQSGG